jgi:hypothetical protein
MCASPTTSPAQQPLAAQLAEDPRLQEYRFRTEVCDAMEKEKAKVNNRSYVTMELN